MRGACKCADCGHCRRNHNDYRCKVILADGTRCPCKGFL